MCDQKWTEVGLDENRERGKTMLWDVRISISLGLWLGDEKNRYTISFKI